jgi:thiamine-phosphate pyrophosphorylase
VVTDDRVLDRTDFVRVAEAVLEVGGERVALHVRGPSSSGARLFALCRRLSSPARQAGATLVVNDRVDVALAAGMDAVHLGIRSLPADVVRAMLGEGALVGASCHTRDEVTEARDTGADYAFAGAVNATGSHPGRAAIGSAGLGALVESAVGMPVLAIGGGRVADVGELWRAGAHGMAVVSGVWAAADPTAAVTEYISRLTATTSEVQR